MHHFESEDLSDLFLMVKKKPQKAMERINYLRKFYRNFLSNKKKSQKGTRGNAKYSSASFLSRGAIASTARTFSKIDQGQAQNSRRINISRQNVNEIKINKFSKDR